VKRRFISAAPYVDRVVQHALCNLIEPIFERTFIYDSYACRKGKGTHKAVDRFTEYSRKNVYVLKCDIRNYFASIDHEILFQMIQRKIKDPKVLWLIRVIIDSTPNPGIPIGNLTSQIFANLYLNGLDHFIKENIGCRCYLRYMDDLILFGDNKEQLAGWKEEIGDFLGEIILFLHAEKSQLYQTGDGVPFLGYKVYPTHRLVLTQNVRRYRKRMKKYLRLFKMNLISGKKIAAYLQSWLGFTGYADSYHLQDKLLFELKTQGVSP
jgi:hypothetical protein